jgi:hypothetical protein
LGGFLMKGGKNRNRLGRKEKEKVQKRKERNSF